MADRKTLMVVGAGASTEANLPTSQELKTNIASILHFQFRDFRKISGDNCVYDAITLATKDQNPTSGGALNAYMDAAWRIHTAMPQAPSIDNFIDVHQGNEKIELCGKLAIVRAILEAEHSSHMYIDPLQANSSR